MIEELIFEIDYPAHCVHCEGIDEKIKEPVHHPSYEITAACNLRCIFCYSRVAVMRKSAPKPGYYGTMQPKAITISQYGEPFVVGTEKVVGVIRELRRRFGEVRIDVQTNGTLIDPETLGNNPDIVMISLDAGSRENYRRITGGDFFEKVVENIRVMSDFTYTVVRTIFMPGINDSELEKIAEIASDADELFLQPLSIYRENRELIEHVNIEAVESMGEYLKAVQRASEISEVRIPGCLLLSLRKFVEKYGSDTIMFLRRRVFGEVPTLQREWQFKIDL